MSPEFEIETARLRLRALSAGDLEAVTMLGADERVMAPLGGVFSSDLSREWLDRQLAHWRAYGFGRFFVSCEETFVGVVGLSRHDLDAGILPGVEIAWRLAFDQWKKGYATEAARAVIDDGFTRLGLGEIVAITTPDNVRSRRVMERLGMVHSPGETFAHPRLLEGDPLRMHVLYRIRRM